MPPAPLPASAVQKYIPKSFSTRTSSLSPRLASNDSGYNSSSPANGKSPVVPIRSMFPVYNTAVTLAQQSYYPQRPIPVMTSSYARSARQDYSSPIGTPRISSPAQASIANFPLNSLTSRISSPEELNDLWQATHGMEPNPRIKSYDLELARSVSSIEVVQFAHIK